LSTRWKSEELEHLHRLADWNEKNGRPPPKALRNRPILTFEEAEAWQAFNEISSSRQFGFGANPISCGDVLAWCRLNLFPSWRRGWLWRMVKALDVAFLEAQHAKSKADPRRKRDGAGRPAGDAGHHGDSEVGH
jgi:hypothetical protein